MSVKDESDQKFWLKLEFDQTNGNIIKPDELAHKITEQNLPPKQNDQKTSDAPDQKILDRIQGSMFGLALGDALGAHVEFRPYEFMKENRVKGMVGGGTWGLNAGQFTDDTSMALCLANSLIASNGFDAYDQLVRFKWWYRHGYMSSTGNCFDIGAATRDSIEEFEKRQRGFSKKHSIVLDDMDTLPSAKRSQFNTECSKIGVAGNGALMRLCPVPLFFHEDPKIAVQYSGQSAIITHGDPKARDSCRYYGALIVAALKGDDKDTLLSEKFYEKHKDWFGNEDLSDDVKKIIEGAYKNKKGYEDGIRGKGYVIDSLEAALWAFHRAKTFEEGALEVVNLGDDTDTTAAIYGQLAGAHYGYRSLPGEWLKIIYAKKYLDCVSQWLYYSGRKWWKKQHPNDAGSSAGTESSQKNHDRKHDQPKYGRPDDSYSKSSKTNENPLYLMRNAINITGHIGQSYDPITDKLIADRSVHLITRRDENSNQSFEILYGERFRSRNVLHLLNIDPQLCLSINSRLIDPDGIASVLNYSNLYSTNTFGFHYSNCRWETTDIQAQTSRYEAKSDATHIIAGIEYGLDVVVLITVRQAHSQLIENTLKELNRAFKKNTELPSAIYEFDRDYTASAYSNDPALKLNNCKFSQICREIKKKISESPKIPCKYMIYPISYFYPSRSARNQPSFIPIEQDTMKQIEEYLNFWSQLKKHIFGLEKIEKNLKEVGLQGQFEKVKQRYETIQAQFFRDLGTAKEAIIQMRRGEKRKEDFPTLFLKDAERNQIRNNIDDIRYDYFTFIQRLDFITKLKENGFQYRLAEEYNISQSDNLDSLTKKLTAKSEQIFLLSNEFLNTTHPAQLEESLRTLQSHHHQTRTKELIYVDFSNNTFQLESIITHSIDQGQKRLTPTKTHPRTPEAQSAANKEPSSNKIPNVLLLGAEKSGKSDIINILHNYMESNPAEANTQSKRNVKIAVARAYSINLPESEPRLINLGDSCDSERVSMEGTSTTMKCRAHSITLHCGRQLRIIDTPGFSSQSEEKNDRLIDEISSNVLDPSSLTAICVVMQSKEKDLRVYDSFLKKFMNWFGALKEKQLIFCFTDYLKQRPCDLKRDSIREFVKRIRTLSIWNGSQPYLQICLFDSQFFAHLATHQFLNRSDHQYDMSRQLSQDGVKNLASFIFDDSSGSVRRDQFGKNPNIQLKHYVRPILETIRNNYRNILIMSSGPHFSLVELHPSKLKRMSAICMTCIRPAHQYSAFWILEDKLSDYHQDYAACGCSIMEQKRVDYALHYQEVPKSNQTADALKKQNDRLIDLMINLSKSAGKKTTASRDDLFIQDLNTMISDETYICDNYSYSHYNGELAKSLVFLKKIYSDKIVENDRTTYLQPGPSGSVEQYIAALMRIDDVRKQIETFHILK